MFLVSYLFEFIIVGILICLVIFLVFIIIKKRKSLKISLFCSFLLIAFVILCFKFHQNGKEVDQERERAFLGNYRLEEFDGKNCANCLVKVYADHHYDIIRQNKIIGDGKWTLDSAPDIPGYFIKIENGPDVLFSDNRDIDYIDQLNK